MYCDYSHRWCGGLCNRIENHHGNICHSKCVRDESVSGHNIHVHILIGNECVTDIVRVVNQNGGVRGQTRPNTAKQQSNECRPINLG